MLMKSMFATLVATLLVIVIASPAAAAGANAKLVYVSGGLESWSPIKLDSYAFGGVNDSVAQNAQPSGIGPGQFRFDTLLDPLWFKYLYGDIHESIDVKLVIPKPNGSPDVIYILHGLVFQNIDQFNEIVSANGVYKSLTIERIRTPSRPHPSLAPAQTVPAVVSH